MYNNVHFSMFSKNFLGSILTESVIHRQLFAFGSKPQTNGDPKLTASARLNPKLNPQ